jgi:hypothetical protein
MLKGVGLGLAGPSFFTACFSQGALTGRRPPGSGEAVAFSFAGLGTGLWNHAALSTAPSGTMP